MMSANTRKLKIEGTLSAVFHYNTALRLLLCVPSMVYLYDLRMSIVKHFSVVVINMNLEIEENFKF